MIGREIDRERGQVLIMVAVMGVALFGFVALAVDGGNVYGGRRRMQNAADAAALAGAREICFGGHPDFNAAHAAAEAVALEYAIARNGAQTATVQFPDDYTVDVAAAQTLDTFFAGVIGMSTAGVRAEAAAMCSGTDSGGGLWPLAFNYEEYINEDEFPCGEPFMVFSSQDDQGPNLTCAEACCYDTDGNELDEEPDGCNCSGLCNCVAIGIHWDTDDRGWLRFPAAGENRPDECKANDNCGAEALKCYLEHDYPGEIKEEDCVPGEPGTVAAVKQAVESRIGDILRVILWDDVACTVPDGWCPGDPYHVKDFGCIKVLSWEQSYKLSKWGSNSTCKTFHAIEAVKICDEEPYQDEYQEFCTTQSVPGSGEMPDEWEVRAVSLVK